MVLIAGSGCLLCQCLQPDASADRQQDALTAVRLRALAVRGAREAQEKGDLETAAFYRNMALATLSRSGG